MGNFPALMLSVSGEEFCGDFKILKLALSILSENLLTASHIFACFNYLCTIL